MSIAYRASSLILASILVAAAGAAFADESSSAKETPPAAESSTPIPAEPVPAASTETPVMPTTVVRPGGIETDAQAATKPPAATTTAARPAAKPDTTPRRAVAPSGFQAVEVGRPASRWRGFPISLSLRDAPLPEVLRSFARIAGVNLVLAPGVKGSVTVELKDVPWDQTLWVILKTHGLGAEIDGRIWTVEPH